MVSSLYEKENSLVKYNFLWLYAFDTELMYQSGILMSSQSWQCFVHSFGCFSCQFSFFLMHISPSFFLNDFFLLLPSLPHYIVRLLRPLSNSTFSFSELDSACLRLECPTLISFPLPLLSSLVFDFFYFSIYLHWRNGSRAVRIDRWMTRG